jgi:hypothetical protein
MLRAATVDAQLGRTHLDEGDIAHGNDRASGGLLGGVGRQQHAADGLHLLLVDLDEHAVAHGLDSLELRGQGGEYWLPPRPQPPNACMAVPQRRHNTRHSMHGAAMPRASLLAAWHACMHAWHAFHLTCEGIAAPARTDTQRVRAMGREDTDAFMVDV